MPEYKRFVAYFYEYIDGKRQRNAGFVKAEKRNGKWKLQIQIRTKGLPREQLPICVYTPDGGQYCKIQLGETYPQGDMLSKVLLAEEGENGMPEILCGMWIGCDDRRCYISHWCEGTIRPEQLLEPEDSKEEDAKGSETEEVVDSEPKETVDSRTEIESNSGVVDAGDSDAAEIVKEINLQAEEAGAEAEERSKKTGIEVEEKPEKAIREIKSETEIISEEDVASDKHTELEEHISQEEITFTEEHTSQEEITFTEEHTSQEEITSPVKHTASKEYAGSDEDAISGEDTISDEDIVSEKYIALEDHSVPEVYSEETAKGETEANKVDETQPQAISQEIPQSDQGLPRSTAKADVHRNRERDWAKLQSRHGSCQPLEGEHIQAVMICPGDILWLQSRGWPVGRSSFLMQGFCQHRHLLLAREDDGSFWLGVPGYENRRSQKEACAFGFPHFRRKRAMKSGMGSFGYWCRKIEEKSD